MYPPLPSLVDGVGHIIMSLFGFSPLLFTCSDRFPGGTVFRPEAFRHAIRFCIDSSLRPLIAMQLGVSHNPDPIPPVRGIDTASWNNDRFDFVTLTFQISAHLVECQVDDTSNILTNDPSWLCFLYNSQHFWPEVTVVILASLLTRD
jgi:hypothetical protein